MEPPPVTGWKQVWPGVLGAVARRAAAEQSDTERAWLRLVTILPFRLHERAMAEVERRTALFLVEAQRSPHAVVVSPKRAGVESVYDDLVAGRWR